MRSNAIRCGSMLAAPSVGRRPAALPANVTPFPPPPRIAGVSRRRAVTCWLGVGFGASRSISSMARGDSPRRTASTPAPARRDSEGVASPLERTGISARRNRTGLTRLTTNGVAMSSPAPNGSSITPLPVRRPARSTAASDAPAVKSASGGTSRPSAFSPRNPISPAAFAGRPARTPTLVGPLTVKSLRVSPTRGVPGSGRGFKLTC